MEKILLRTVEDTERFGEEFAATLAAGDVLALTGELGAGKTAFARGLARGLGYAGRVTSPTFAIVGEYLGGRLDMFHFDLYRLGGEDELYDIGWEDYLARGGVCAVEWAQRAPGAFGEDAIRLDFRVLGDGTREVTVTRRKE